jgi:hypothetical protein
VAEQRKIRLLLDAAAALDEGTDPFDESWLIEHRVTLDECFDLSAQLAVGARMVVQAMREVRQPGSELTGSGLERVLSAAGLAPQTETDAT